jgi:mono/diheme cytochrome c family protein
MLIRLTCLAAWLALPLFAAAQEPEAPLPGLVAEYRSVGVSVCQVDAKPAFYVGHASPHPRLPPGPFEVTWTGVIQLRDEGLLSFSAFAGGKLSMQVDGKTVLDVHGASDQVLFPAKGFLKREPGYYPVKIRFQSGADVPARLQLFWEAPSFAREPIPAWRFSHRAADESPALHADLKVLHGRAMAERFGCARCHSSAFPGVSEPQPGPSLADAGHRLKREWVLNWLAGPAKVRDDARMPALFADDRAGFAERWLIADYLTRGEKRDESLGDHRQGRMAFVGLGCGACHFVPDIDRKEQPDLGRTPLTGLGDRLPPGDLAAFLGNPLTRYPDGRMPRLPVTPEQARNIAAFLLLWSKPTEPAAAEAPKPEELRTAIKRAGGYDATSAAVALLSRKGCTSCHPGLGPSTPLDVPINDRDAGCVAGKSSVRFAFVAPTRDELRAFLDVAAKEHSPSPFVERQHKLSRAGCVRCHQRDTNRPSPIEEAGATLGGAFLQEVPFQRTPRLTNPHQKYMRSYLAATVREGTSGLRTGRYTYRMPSFGADADVLVQALAEADGELPAAADPPSSTSADPTLGTLTGPALVGSQGYSCISCHAWNGRHLVSSDPGAAGPDLTRTLGRVRRDWFDRFLDDPQRAHPGTPMPAVFERGKRAMLTSVLAGDPAKQKDALWAYLAKGKSAPEPKPAPPVPVEAPAAGEPPLIAQIPIRLPEGGVVESISVLWPSHDLLIYDLATFAPHSVRTGAQIARSVQGRTRQCFATGVLVPGFRAEPPRDLSGERVLHGYDRLADGVRIRWRAGDTEASETLRLAGRTLVREVSTNGSPPKRTEFALPPAKAAPEWKENLVADPGRVEGSLERPGYRAVAYPRPKTVSGEDRIMPVALAAHPRDGRVFVASLKTGEIFVVRGDELKFENYGHGVFQDALSMLGDDDALYVLHRRNLTKITDGGHFDRVALLPQAVADAYDYGYGLARDKTGAFVLSLAQYGDAKMIGAGGAVRLEVGPASRAGLQELAYGYRNPLGWCAGPDGEVFCTDNQGEWVPANKLCHVAAGRYYGFPNHAQPQHTKKPAGRTAVWVPYGWAHSINGMAFDHTGGKFGPFAGQFFLAELMFGGAIIRADVEKVNGEYQGCCFPFWGKGLMGPVALTFDAKGRLFVGGITEPGWMAQPDRGALFRIDYTGETPFEMKTIRVRPRGFRIEFTKPVDPSTAGDPRSYHLEHYRYEITGAYGSPELDRTNVAIERIEVAADGRSAELTTSALVKDRVYLIEARSVKSATGDVLVNPLGAYTLNELPAMAH